MELFADSNLIVTNYLIVRGLGRGLPLLRERGFPSLVRRRYHREYPSFMEYLSNYAGNIIEKVFVFWNEWTYRSENRCSMKETRKNESGTYLKFFLESSQSLGLNQLSVVLLFSLSLRKIACQCCLQESLCKRLRHSNDVQESRLNSKFKNQLD